MAREWRNGTLSELVELKRGYDLPQQNRQPGPVPVVSSSGITDYHAEAMVAGPGVVTGRYGTIGKVFYIDEDYWPLNTTLYVRDFKGNDRRFVRYFLETVNFWSYSDKAAVPGVNRNHLHQARIRYPPDVGEQQAIAHILGTLDDKIDLNRRMNETLEAIARAIFKSWFVDFDPVRAKAEGPDAGLPVDIASRFPNAFQESDFGQIPAGWTVGTVGGEFAITMGQSPPGETYNEEGRGSPFYQGRMDFGFRFPKRRIFCTAPARTAEAGDTLVSVRAPVGDVNMASERCCIGRGVAAVRHRSGSRSYSYYFMQAIEQVFALFEMEGTVFGAISGADFRKIHRVMPPDDLITAFDRLVSPIDDKIAANERQSQTLTALRDTLLPKLISGEVRVPQAARLVEAAGG
jgi:type I restriction enzyme, S subunit